MNEKEKRIKALSKFLEIKKEDIEGVSWDEEVFEAEGNDYLVLTDEEAGQRTADYIKERVWAFNAWFLVDHMPDGIEEDVIKLVQEKCEGGNEALKRMIVDFDKFVDDAIGTDGRGHFLNQWDGSEEEQGEYFIYRQ